MNQNFAAKRAQFIKKSKDTVMEALRSRDMVLGGVTKTIVDLDETINIFYERLEEWYGIYFPELKLDDKIKYVELVLSINRDDLNEEDLVSMIGQKKASEIVSQSKNSLGAKLAPNDLSECHALAKSILSLDKLRSQYEKYQKQVASELCPNMTEIGGADVAAKLVSHVGSLRKLALLPASTIQVLGAEKALFKHLKNRRIAPPKHGIIFQHPRISSSPKSVRGKIARLLANQLNLASKADAFTKRNISAMLKKKFDDQFARIMKDYEKMKLKKPKLDSNVEEKKEDRGRDFNKREFNRRDFKRR